jgi:hypothetical protein
MIKVFPGAEESATMLDALYEIGEQQEFIFEHEWSLAISSCGMD